jgi:sulfur carrier protein
MNRAADPRVTIQVNGEPREIVPGTPLPDLLASLGLPAQAVLVEHNGTALFRADWPATLLAAGDRLEIIRVVAGG